MKITPELLKEIAQELDAGMKVFINKDTLEIKSILDWEDILDNEPWEKEMEEIDRTWSNFAVITKMESREAFKVMESFIDEVEDAQFREGLVKILSRKSPFANFKAEIETSPYRQNWFDFKQKKYEEYAGEKLEEEGFIIE
jgi:hypothetical protein